MAPSFSERLYLLFALKTESFYSIEINRLDSTKKTSGSVPSQILKLTSDLSFSAVTKAPFTLNRCNFCSLTEGVTVQPTVNTVTSYP